MGRGDDSAKMTVQRRGLDSEGRININIDSSSEIDLFQTDGALESRIEAFRKNPNTVRSAKVWQKLLPARELVGFERVNAFYTLLELSLEEGIEPPEIETMRRELSVSGDYDDKKVLALHHLQNVLPLLDIGTPSGQIFKQMLKDNCRGQDIMEAASKAEPEAIHHAARITEMLLASMADGNVPLVEKAVHDNFEFARERSQIFNRTSKYTPLTVSPDTLWMMGFRDQISVIPKLLELKIMANGFAYANLPGDGGVEPTIIVAQTKEGRNGPHIDIPELRKTMIHEMIHDNQESDTISMKEELPEWSDAEKTQFLEALTEGLAVLRMKGDDHPDPVIAPGPYQAYVSSLFSLLKEAGVQPEEYEDRLTYLNNIPLGEAASVLGEWLGGDVRELFRENLLPDVSHLKKKRSLLRPIKTLKEAKRALEEHHRVGMDLIQDVFRASPALGKKTT